MSRPLGTFRAELEARLLEYMRLADLWFEHHGEPDWLAGHVIRVRQALPLLALMPPGKYGAHLERLLPIVAMRVRAIADDDPAPFPSLTLAGHHVCEAEKMAVDKLRELCCDSA